MRKWNPPHVRGPWLILLVFALVFGSITFVNHQQFRTHALDLGVYTHASWDYAQGDVDDSTSFRAYSEPILSDHFDLHLLLYSPLVRWLGAWGLLLIQWLALLWGALGVYRLAKFKNANSAIAPMLHLLVFFALFQALGYDYHSNVIASMALPWWILALEKRQTARSWMWLIFILFAKENMAAWMIFCTSGMWFIVKGSTRIRIQLVLQSIFSAIYFYAIVFQVMPFLATDGSASNLQYSLLSELAQSPSISEFLNLLKALFINHGADSYGDYFKLEFYMMFLLSGGLLLFRKPAFLWMLLPVIGWKMWHDHPSMWGINGQYAIELAPIVVVGTLYSLSKFQVNKRLYAAVVIFAAICTIRSMDDPVVPVDRAALRFYQPAHYQRDFDVAKAHKLLDLIPADASVSAQSSVHPHLADRQNIFLFPHLFDADYVVLSHEERTFPLSIEAYDKEKKTLLSSGSWLRIAESDYLLILKRKKVRKP